MSDIKRTVYSLVLMDDVIKAVDQMAYEMRTSRSNLINQLLAEKVMLRTPEMKVRDIFDKIFFDMEGYKKFQLQLQPSDYCISIRSVLDYKYNPTVRYFVQLYRSEDRDAIGELKITSRTQSRQLQDYLFQFFEYFSGFEQVYMPQFFPRRPIQQFISSNDGKFERRLIIEKQNQKISTDMIAEAIGDYIQLIDNLLNIYITHLHNIEKGLNKMEKEYVIFLKNKPILI